MNLIDSIVQGLKNKFGGRRIGTADEILSAVYDPDTQSLKLSGGGGGGGSELYGGDAKVLVQDQEGDYTVDGSHGIFFVASFGGAVTMENINLPSADALIGKTVFVHVLSTASGSVDVVDPAGTASQTLAPGYAGAFSSVTLAGNSVWFYFPVFSSADKIKLDNL